MGKKNTSLIYHLFLTQQKNSSFSDDLKIPILGQITLTKYFACKKLQNVG